MEPSILASAAVALLSPYLERLRSKPGEQLAETSSKRALERLHETMRARLGPGTYEGALLDGVEQRPDSKRRQSALQAALADALEEDPAFAVSLKDLVQDAAADRQTEQVIDSGAVSISGNVTLRGKNVAGRDITIGPIEREKPEAH